LQPHEYQRLYEFESTYWWFLGLHGIMLDTLKSLSLSNSANILDAGCGTGQNLSNVTKQISKDAFGFDVASEALKFWKLRDLNKVCLASINDIPFKSNWFDVVISLDVFECTGVDEEQAVAELWRVAKPGGFLILVVPAYKWMMTKEHHEAVGANRRYTKESLKKVLKTKPMKLMRMSHLFAAVFPAIAAYRLIKKIAPDKSNHTPKSELQHLNPPLNKLLTAIVRGERQILKRIDLPFGSSILAVCQKVS
jgi:ubiquinone/menaquinone biosynthesis C-methylase UbiE